MYGLLEPSFHRRRHTIPDSLPIPCPSLQKALSMWLESWLSYDELPPSAQSKSSRRVSLIRSKRGLCQAMYQWERIVLTITPKEKNATYLRETNSENLQSVSNTLSEWFLTVDMKTALEILNECHQLLPTFHQRDAMHFTKNQIVHPRPHACSFMEKVKELIPIQEFLLPTLEVLMQCGISTTI